MCVVPLGGVGFSVSRMGFLGVPEWDFGRPEWGFGVLGGMFGGPVCDFSEVLGGIFLRSRGSIFYGSWVGF